MKIAHVVCTFPPYKGGVGNVAYHFARLSYEQSRKITVFTPNYKRDEVHNKNYINFSNIIVARLAPMLAYGNGAFLPQLLWRLKRFNIVYLHYPFFGGAEVIWLAKLILGRKMKLVIHYHMDVAGLPWMIKALSFPSRLIRHSLFRRADKITCASLDYIKYSDIADFYKKSPNKFVEVPFGVDINTFKPSDKLPACEKKTILFVGGLDKAHYFKGIEVLLNAVAGLRVKELGGWQLVIVGDGDLKSQYEQQAKKLNIYRNIKFVGLVSNNQLVSYYQQANVLVLPSINKNEAFGLVLLEAMACGIPVIASALPGVRSVFQNRVQGLLVEPKSVEDLKNKIEQILINNENRKRMGLAGRKLVEEKYSWKKVGEKLGEVYDDVS